MNDPAANAPRTILVTGATGRLGIHTCQALRAHGHRVRATDRRFRPDFPERVIVGDLTDEGFVYSVVEGCDAVVHLGNYPNTGAGPSRPGVLAENMAMNANVIYAAIDLGVKTIVFASSIQAMIRLSGQRGMGPFQVPYLPLDGNAPADPGSNPYGLSKEFGERLLFRLCEVDAELSATALRFPMLPDESWLERIARGVPKSQLNWADCLTYLPLSDAAEVIARYVERARPGYSQYLPTTTFDVPLNLADVVAEHYPRAPLKCAASELCTLADESFARELGLHLRPRVRARFIED